MLSGLGVGAVLPSEIDLSWVTLPALALQTGVTVGALPSIRRTGGVRRGLALLGLHHLCMTLPLALAALIIGVETQLGFGVFLMAAAPPAALVPTYAEAIELDVPAVLAFVFIAYAGGLLITPALLLLVAGTTAGTESIVTTLAVGLILPSLAGRALHGVIGRIPERRRRLAVAAFVFLITLGLGGDLVTSVSSGSVTLSVLGVTLLVLTGRTLGTGWLAARFAPASLRMEARLAGGYKNIALAAAVAAQLAGPVAALPALLGFPFEGAYFVLLARRRARSQKLASQG
jgi:predicted Na+-dependent transporter